MDRWLWLRKNLPPAQEPAVLVDIGCGSGTYTNAAAKLGYQAIGVSFDAAQNEKARYRASWLDLPSVFINHDIRNLDELTDLRGVADESIKTTDIYKGVVPFIIIQLIVLITVMIFPFFVL